MRNDEQQVQSPWGGNKCGIFQDQQEQCVEKNGEPWEGFEQGSDPSGYRVKTRLQGCKSGKNGTGIFVTGCSEMPER